MGHFFNLNVYLSRPYSRGSCKLQSTDPRDHLKLEFNFLEDERDRKALISGVRKCREIMQQKAFDSRRGKETWEWKSMTHDGATDPTDAEILEFLAKNCKSAHHPVGTCKMGNAETDPDVVVDGQLKVVGIQNLRVADASVFPTHT